MTAITQPEIDQQVFDLYDEYCHGRMERREFLKRAGALGALTFALSLLPDYARAQTISFTDTRIKAHYVTYPSPGGNADKMRGYLVQPAGNARGHDFRLLFGGSADLLRARRVEPAPQFPEHLRPAAAAGADEEDEAELVEVLLVQFGELRALGFAHPALLLLRLGAAGLFADAGMG